MTRQEKLAQCDNHFLPQIEAKRITRDEKYQVYMTKDTEYRDKLIEYQNKINEINIYYDAQDKINELENLQEPVI